MVTFVTGHSIVNLSTTPYLKILTNRSFPYFMNINKLSPQKTFEKLLIFNVSIGPSFDTFTILQAWCNFCLYVSMLQSLCFYKHATTFMFMQACYNLLHFYDLDTLLQHLHYFLLASTTKFHTNCLQRMHTIRV